MNYEKILKDLEEICSQNGGINVGISSGSDAVIKESNKLALKQELEGLTVEDRRKEAIEFSISHLTKVQGEHEDITKFKVGCIIAGHVFGLFAHPKDCRDVKYVKEMGTGVFKAYKDIDVDFIGACATFMTATKLNLFATNHHVGQGKLSGFALKVINVKFNNSEDMKNSYYDAGHTVGHWASTHIIFNLLGFKNVKEVDSYIPGKQIVFEDDIKLRSLTAPAGMAKFYLIHQGFKRLINHSVAKYIPNLEKFVAVSKAVQECKKEPLKFHIGATYFTGKTRAVCDDFDANDYLGIIGTFLDIFYPRSTLIESPWLSKGKSRIYESYNDYDPELATLLKGFKISQMDTIKEQVEVNKHELKVLDKEAIARIKAAIKDI